MSLKDAVRRLFAQRISKKGFGTCHNFKWMGWGHRLEMLIDMGTVDVVSDGKLIYGTRFSCFVLCTPPICEKDLIAYPMQSGKTGAFWVKSSKRSESVSDLYEVIMYYIGYLEEQ